MAVLNVRIDADELSILELNDVFTQPAQDGTTFNPKGDSRQALVELANFLRALASGQKSASSGSQADSSVSVQIDSTAVAGDVAITPAGTGATQLTYTI